MLSMASYGMGYPFCQLESGVSAVSPPNFLCTHILLTPEESYFYSEEITTFDFGF